MSQGVMLTSKSTTSGVSMHHGAAGCERQRSTRLSQGQNSGKLFQQGRAFHGQRRHDVIKALSSTLAIYTQLVCSCFRMQTIPAPGRTQHTCGSPSVLILEGRNRSCLRICSARHIKNHRVAALEHSASDVRLTCSMHASAHWSGRFPRSLLQAHHLRLLQSTPARGHALQLFAP